MLPWWSRKLVNGMLGRAGYQIRRIESEPDTMPGCAYQENPEAGPMNMPDKLARQARGEPFEWPDILALNRTVASMTGGARRIVELGSGTGAFAWAAAENPDVHVTASEFDAAAHAWAAAHRSRANIRYVNGPVSAADGPFDLLVTIEVVEHVADYAGFLASCCGLADKAIVTTPNKLRSATTATAGPPPYYQHVREWSAGEFYWVLRAFYRHVELFGMPDPNTTGAVPVRVTSTLSPLIAVCEQPWSRPS